MLATLFFILLVFLPHAAAQESAFAAQFDIVRSMESVTVDTSIPGERESTVELAPERIELSEELRSLRMSGSMYPEYARMGAPARGDSVESGDQMSGPPETFGGHEGLAAYFDGLFGMRTLGDMGAVVSFTGGNRAGVLRCSLRSRNENTPSNLAPSTRTFEGIGYCETPYGRYALEFSAAGEKEGAISERFRSRDRKMNRYTLGIRGSGALLESWDVNGSLLIDGAKYSDHEIPFTRSETGVEGNLAATRKSSDLSLSAHTGAAYRAFGAKSGSFLSLGGTVGMQPMERLWVKGGADLSVYAPPGEGMNVRLYPCLTADWALSPRMYARLKAAPRVVLHAFHDIYRMNGLVTPAVPLLFEDKKLDISAEYGLRLDSGLEIGARAFLTRSVHPPVFSSSGNFFDVVDDARVTVTGLRAAVNYERAARWGVEGEMTVRNAGWNHSGDVPYLPSYELAASGHFIPFRFWTFRSTLRIAGKHSVGKDSNATAAGPAIIDIGVERELRKNRAAAYFTIRNLLNADGAWWTEAYPVPGTGLYAGIRARY